MVENHRRKELAIDGVEVCQGGGAARSCDLEFRRRLFAARRRHGHGRRAYLFSLVVNHLRHRRHLVVVVVGVVVISK